MKEESREPIDAVLKAGGKARLRVLRLGDKWQRWDNVISRTRRYRLGEAMWEAY